MVTVVITPRPQVNGRGDHHAQIENHPELWANGWTPDEAFGNLVLTYSERFGLQDCAGLIDNPDLSYKDVGELVRKDAQKLGIEIRNMST